MLGVKSNVPRRRAQARESALAVPASALLLALAAAFLHAGWNLLLARAPDTQSAAAVALALAVVIFAPVAALTWDVDSAAIPYIAASAALELAYFALLAFGYDRGELSVVYPVARGSAPVLVLAVSVIALGVALSGLQVAGVLLVAGGIAAVRGVGSEPSRRDLAVGLAIGCLIAAYTLVDKQGLRHADPLPYLELVLLAPAAFYLAAMTYRRGPTALRAQLGATTLAAALGMFGAYALALAALRLAPAAPVAAVRETSIVIATALAAVFLHERVGRLRLAGAAVVVAGVAALALG